MWFGLVVLLVWKRVKNHLWISLNRLITVWIDSIKSLTSCKSIHIYLNWFMYASSLFYFESAHKTLWPVLNRFLQSLNRINLHPGYTWIDSNMIWIVSSFILFWSGFWLSESIQAFSESIQFVKFVRKLSLFTPHYIYTPLPFFKVIESFASILSRSQKLIAHTFFKIKHFFL